MIALQQRLSRFHPVVWWIIGATGITRMTQFMVLPFMALYMSAHTHARADVIGLALGTGSLVATLAGFVTGPWVDRHGRKKAMVVAMLLRGATMAAYVAAHTVPLFFVLSAMNGFTRILFEPAAQAMMTDLTPDDTRPAAFGMRYWAINVGASVGPLVGAYFGTVATSWTFFLSAAVHVLYAFIILWRFPESLSDREAQSNSPQTNRALKAGFVRRVLSDKAFVVFILALLLTNIGYSQIETTLPQYLATLVGVRHAATLFALLVTSNAIEVVLLQLPLTHMLRRLTTIRSITLGALLFGLGYFGLGTSSRDWSLFLFMFVLTVGEIITFPKIGTYVSILARSDLRGTYFGLSSMGQVGFFLGPWVGGIILEHGGGERLFMSVGVLVAASAVLHPVSESLRRSELASREPAEQVMESR